MDTSADAKVQILGGGAGDAANAERDKFGRKILKTNIKSVKIIEPEPKVTKPKSESETKKGRAVSA